MADAAEKEVKKAPEPKALAEFLESTPPGQIISISDLAQKNWSRRYGGEVIVLRSPEILLHCTSNRCNGPRIFRYLGDDPERPTKVWDYYYVKYLCSNCQETTKIFSLAAKLDDDGIRTGQCYKFGELPAFGPPISARLIKLIGPDREEFLKGRGSEIQGLGIGAFTYYRRVVVNQKNRILAEIIRVAEKIDPKSAAIPELRAAIEETQFSKALEMVKAAIPQALLINGHNPLRVLHGALSDGVHDRTDEECLEIATSVRVVLAELSERLGQALKDEAEITKALGTLMKRGAAPADPKREGPRP